MGCNGCDISIAECVRMCEDDGRIKDFLVSHKLINNSVDCPTCGSEVPMNWSRKNYRCQKQYIDSNNRKKKCVFQRSIWKNTFFEKTHLAFNKVLLFVVYWVHLAPPRVNIVRSELRISTKTITDWMNFFREVCLFFVERQKQLIGGPGQIVEVDEAKIGKRKYNRGRIVEGQWVFGGIQRSDPRKCFLVAVGDRSRETLMHHIRDNIAPGSHVMSDCWRAYDNLPNEGKTILYT